MKIRLIITIVATVFLFMVTAGVSQAGSVGQTNFPTDWISIDQYSPVGQTFTAVDDSTISTISFFFDVTDYLASPDTLTVSVYDGTGFNGTLLGSQVYSLPVSNPFDWYDVDFSSSDITISQGEIYTLGISSTTTRWALGKNQILDSNGQPYGSPDYVGGMAIINGSGDNNNDLAFQVASTPIVPEPLSSVLFVIGASVLVGRYIKRKKTSV
jgi:hypothetical protein